MSSCEMNDTKRLWSDIAQYAAPPLAASCAIVPVFYGFAAKSAQQLGNPIPRMTLREALKGGFKASPTIGAIVGTQLITQNIAEEVLIKKIKHVNEFYPMFAGSLIVGSISAPALAVFNGQTMGQTPMESLKRLSAKQAGAIVSRETSFLFALRISDPLANAMKQSFGDNKAVEYGSAFFSGAIGSVIGHAPDTALTLWQKEMQVTNLRQLMRGAPMKAVATGGFTVCYKLAKSILDSVNL